ncbi:hypothetical protein PoB_006951500 [Plakobranchus ocellatus]|uniref:Uncharacterized protein n=1 Tax=Plakobranchus ocellatus TaxID=259542 RepID=A0AAV4DG93_9GAST|nr:hypothetical protein PoB_006951500 [Plakobranchus ocellatus]
MYALPSAPQDVLLDAEPELDSIVTSRAATRRSGRRGIGVMAAKHQDAELNACSCDCFLLDSCKKRNLLHDLYSPCKLWDAQ